MEIEEVIKYEFVGGTEMIIIGLFPFFNVRFVARKSGVHMIENRPRLINKCLSIYN